MNPMPRRAARQSPILGHRPYTTFPLPPSAFPLWVKPQFRTIRKNETANGQERSKESLAKNTATPLPVVVVGVGTTKGGTAIPAVVGGLGGFLGQRRLRHATCYVRVPQTPATEVPSPPTLSAFIGAREGDKRQKAVFVRSKKCVVSPQRVSDDAPSSALTAAVGRCWRRTLP